MAYQAAQNEGDQVGQLSIAETMITQGVSVLLVSPQTNSNLEPALGEAASAHIPVINVNDAVIPEAEHYVGNVQRDNGVRVAKWFIANRPTGGKLAVIEGQAGVYAAAQRTNGFKATIADAGTKFQVVASVPGNWDRQLSYDAATTILQQHPDLIGFYCNNDTMALGVVEAVKNANLLGKVAVFGTDGISDAYKSIRAGELTGTVDSFPVLTGEVALEAALRILAKETLPRVVATPQALITKDTADRYKGSGRQIRAHWSRTRRPPLTGEGLPSPEGTGARRPGYAALQGDRPARRHARLQVQDVTKTYPGVRALDDDVAARPARRGARAARRERRRQVDAAEDHLRRAEAG